MVLVIDSSSLIIFVTSLSTGTKKTIYFSVFSPIQLNCPSNFTARSFVINW